VSAIDFPLHILSFSLYEAIFLPTGECLMLQGFSTIKLSNSEVMNEQCDRIPAKQGQFESCILFDDF